MRVLAVFALFSAAAVGQTAVAPDAAKPGRLEGSATDPDRIPIAGAFVSLVSATEGRVIAGAQTSFEGRYVLESVPAGTYILAVSRDGYAASFYSSARGVREPAQIVIEPGAVLKGIDVQLERAGSISGTVVDQDGGPVANAIVRAYRLFVDGPKRSATAAGAVTADGSGRYNIQGLAPDTYFIAASPSAARPPRAQAQSGGKAEPREVATYYPNAADLNSAAPIPVRPSDQANGIDVRMRRVPAVSVQGAVSPVESGLRVRLWQAGQPIWTSPQREAVIDADGGFQFDAVPHGKYQVYAFDAKQSRYARAELEVAETDMRSVQLRLRPALTIQGRVAVLEPGRNLPLGGIEVFLNPVDMLAPGRQIFARSDGAGSLRIAQVPPGRYNVYVPHVPEKSYVKDVRLGSENAGPGFEVNVTDGEERELLVGISARAGSLGGVVTNDAGAPVARAVAVTVPDVPGGPAFREVTNDRGEFLERNLPTGRFTVYAFESFDIRLLANPRALSKFERYAQHVTITEGERAAAKLKIIPEPSVR